MYFNLGDEFWVGSKMVFKLYSARFDWKMLQQSLPFFFHGGMAEIVLSGCYGCNMRATQISFRRQDVAERWVVSHHHRTLDSALTQVSLLRPTLTGLGLQSLFRTLMPRMSYGGHLAALLNLALLTYNSGTWKTGIWKGFGYQEVFLSKANFCVPLTSVLPVVLSVRVAVISR
ncbi:hypothetical protein J6590_048025 [Homalodisca vitripennis]|nr:hypothetical protein J6590_048025 [Homalodisca vitripennis]